MAKGAIANIFRVFCNLEGKFGNPVGIILDEKNAINPHDRQKISTKLGFSESVFINNLATGNISIFNPKKEVNFAGHALVGTAYYINQITKKSITSLECKVDIILAWQEKDLTWIRASLKNTPPWLHEQLKDAPSVETLSLSQTASKKHTVVWAWLDQNKGIIRARTFAPDWGISEDEANGSGSMQLAATLGQKLEIHHGNGSVIYAKPTETGFADVGGRVEKDTFQKVEI